MSATTVDHDSIDTSSVTVPDDETVDSEHHLAALTLEKNIRSANRSEFAVDTVRTGERGSGFIECRLLKPITSFRTVKRNLGEESDQLKDIQLSEDNEFTVVLHPTE